MGFKKQKKNGLLSAIRLLTPFWGFNCKLLYHYLVATADNFAKISHVDKVPFPFYAHTPTPPRAKELNSHTIKAIVSQDAFIQGNSNDMVCRWWCWFTSHYNVAPIFYWYDRKYETPTAAQALCIFPCICREVYHACRKNKQKKKNKWLICQINGKLLHYIINTQYSCNCFPRGIVHFYWWLPFGFAFNKVTAGNSLPPSWIAKSRKHLFSQACVAWKLHAFWHWNPAGSFD